MDAETAFFNNTLDEKTYIQQPEDYVEPEKELVCRLKKSLCGLTQSQRCWNIAFKECYHWDLFEAWQIHRKEV